MAVGALAAVQYSAFPILNLFAGALVDRWRRRLGMLVADMVRLLALATILIAAFARVLSFAQLLMVAACIGIASVFFDVAYQTLVPSLVELEDLERANARLALTESAAQIAGNGFADALITLIGAPLASLFDATSFAISVLTLWALRVPRRLRTNGSGQRTSFLREVREGIDTVRSSPVSVRITGATATSNLGIAITTAVGLLYMYRVLHLSPALVGVLLAVSNVGFGGALWAPLSTRRFGPGRTMVWSLGIAVVAKFRIPLALWLPTLPALFIAELAITACTLSYNITQVSLFQRTIPADRLGRANATLRTVVWGTLPLGVTARWSARRYARIRADALHRLDCRNVRGPLATDGTRPCTAHLAAKCAPSALDLRVQHVVRAGRTCESVLVLGITAPYWQVAYSEHCDRAYPPQPTTALRVALLQEHIHGKRRKPASARD